MALQISLSGKVVLVSGVTSGIGKGIAVMMGRAEAKVAGCGLEPADSPAALAFLSAMQAAGAAAMYTQTDVTDAAQQELWVDAALAAWSRIDILVSNAGANFFEGATNCTEPVWQQNMELNLSAHWRLCRLCRPYLAANGAGVIIIISSNQAYATMPGCFPYNVTKTALTGLVRALAIEWAPAVRVVGLAPGFIDTPGNQQWFASFNDPAEERARTEALHPVKRIGTAEEAGAWCVFLAGEYGGFASGTTYLLDGGRSALLQDEHP
ncbi:SDR family NAD(P)-dependent oxidoreductase [Chitinophaga sp. 22321]|uniref:SDR family oxidoreductase n=1 Tax=Chitinophaga hostae TaxID=2831022 RepID=A0ABS5J196_9BACT|nr:SDR family oxidoreductase [Chitinophaga hostae]MBS0028991.1 SDR family oxidoreductase [Chitinophaga hostae]